MTRRLTTTAFVRCVLVPVGAALFLAGCAGVTVAPTDVTHESAKLNARLSCEGNASNPCQWQFRYRVAGDAATVKSTPVRGPISTQIEPTLVPEVVDGLTPETAYEYQVCGWGDGIPKTKPRCVGPDMDPEAWQRFTTGVDPNPKPVDSGWRTTDATGVSPYTVTVNAVVTCPADSTSACTPAFRASRVRDGSSPGSMTKDTVEPGETKVVSGTLTRVEPETEYRFAVCKQASHEADCFGPDGAKGSHSTVTTPAAGPSGPEQVPTAPSPAMTNYGHLSPTFMGAVNGAQVPVTLQSIGLLGVPDSKRAGQRYFAGGIQITAAGASSKVQVEDMVVRRHYKVTSFDPIKQTPSNAPWFVHVTDYEPVELSGKSTHIGSGAWFAPGYLLYGTAYAVIDVPGDGKTAFSVELGKSPTVMS